MKLSVPEIEILIEALEYRMIDKDKLWWNDQKKGKKSYVEIAEDLLERFILGDYEDPYRKMAKKLRKEFPNKNLKGIF